VSGQQGTVVLNYGQGVAAYPGQQSGQQQAAAVPGHPGTPVAARPVNSFLSSLNWKHFAAAGLAIVAIIAIPFFLLLDRGAGAPTQPNTPPASPSLPAQQPASGADAPRLDPNTRTAPIPSDNPQSNSSRSGSKPGATRDANSTQSAQPGQPNDRSSSSNTAPAKPSDQTGGTGDARTANSADNKNKGTGSKIGGAVGGAVKKIGGLFGGKKKKEEPKQ
jgi:hypothetical protein